MVSVKSIHLRLQKTHKVYIYVYFMCLFNGLCMISCGSKEIKLINKNRTNDTKRNKPLRKFKKARHWT